MRCGWAPPACGRKKARAGAGLTLPASARRQRVPAIPALAAAAAGAPHSISVALFALPRRQDSHDVASLIIQVGPDVQSGGATVYYDGAEKFHTSTRRKPTQGRQTCGNEVLRVPHRHGCYQVAIFESVVHEGEHWTGKRGIISLYLNHDLQHFKPRVPSRLVQTREASRAAISDTYNNGDGKVYAALRAAACVSLEVMSVVFMDADW